MSSARGCFALSRSNCWKRSGVSSANEGIDSAILFHDLLVVRFDQHLQAEKHLDEICEVGRLPAGRNPRRHLLEEIVCGAELRLQLAVAREGQRLLHARQEKLRWAMIPSTPSNFASTTCGCSWSVMNVAMS